MSTLVVEIIIIIKKKQSYTHKKKQHFGENTLPISLFTYYSLKIKFLPFLKSWPVAILCKRKTIKWVAKLLIRRKPKQQKRARDKD